MKRAAGEPTVPLADGSIAVPVGAALGHDVAWVRNPWHRASNGLRPGVMMRTDADPGTPYAELVLDYAYTAPNPGHRAPTQESTDVDFES